MKNVTHSPDQQSEQAEARSQSSRREGVSFEDVKKVVEKLIQKGQRVSLRLVRAELGTGSLSTIQKHLASLRSMEAPLPPEGPSPLSSQALRALAAEVDRATAERTAKINAELEDAQSSVELLVQENEAMRLSAIAAADASGKLREQLAETTGTLEALRAQLAGVYAQLAASQANADEAKQSLAVSHEQRQAAERRAEQFESELRAAQQERIELQQVLTVSQKDAEAARRAVVGLEVQLQAKQQAEEHLRASTSSSHERLQMLESTQLRLAVLEVERSNQEERVTELKAALARAEENTQRLLENFFSGTSSANGAVGTKRIVKAHPSGT